MHHPLYNKGKKEKKQKTKKKTEKIRHLEGCRANGCYYCLDFSLWSRDKKVTYWITFPWSQNTKIIFTSSELNSQ